MNTVRAINRFISLFLDIFGQFGRYRIWLLLLAYFLLDWLVLFAHYDFVSPLFYGPVNIWTGLFGTQRATGFSHYPGHFLMLPYYYEWARFFVGVIIEGVMLGAVALMFFNGFMKAEDRLSFRVILSSWLHLLLGWLLLNGLMLAFSLTLPEWFSSLLTGSPRRMMVFRFGFMPAVYVAVLSLFFFVIPSIAVFGENVIQAVKRSVSIFFRNPFTCICLALIILAGPLLISIVTGRPDIIVEKFKPELVYWVLLAGLVIDIFVNFFWMGAAVRFLIDEED